MRILVPKRNSGTLTYDGIETGGERVAHEVEDEIQDLKEQGIQVNRFSMVGYSLGGLLARYAAGILGSKGLFDTVEPVNFTTFATPHLGTRTPLAGWSSQLYNDIAARSLSTSGHQMWMIDDFRGTGRHLLAIMADPESIFVRALKRFQRVSIYSNIINDRSVPFYTSCIEDRDPFVDLDSIDINYAPDTDNVILQHKMGDQGSQKPSAVPRQKPMTFYESMSSAASRFIARAPLYFFMVTLAPIGITFFLASSGIQSYKSAARIKDHEEGRGGADFTKYRFELLPEKIKQQALETLTQMTHTHHQETLEDAAAPASTEEGRRETEANVSSSTSVTSTSKGAAGTATGSSTTASPGTGTGVVEESDEHPFQTLALTDDQFEMIRNLNAIGIKKYPVHIKAANHTHAAIIVRMNRPGFGEGRVVAKHWVDRWLI